MLIWWSLLCSAALLNVIVWSIAARLHWRRKADFTEAVYATRRLALWLAGGYVLGCAFRSVLPMVDVPRLCLYDTFASRILVGRTVATIAELCLAAQVALLLDEAGRLNERRWIRLLAPLLFFLIVMAETSSWSAVLTTNNLLHALENSLWTLAAALAIVGFGSLFPHVDSRGVRFIAAVLACGALYLGFMTIVDVPMYIARWRAEVAAGHEPLSLLAGLREIAGHCRVVREWAVWRDDIAWLSLYFSTAVWVSIALAHAPPLAPRQREVSSD